MSFPDIVPELVARLPDLRGRLTANQPLADVTWFRVGGPAQALFLPADTRDLAYVLRSIPADVPVTVIGLGSNLLVRDGGIPGITVRLGRGFAQTTVESGHRIRAGAAVPDARLARAAAEAGIAGLAFYRGIPGCIGGALRMNAGAHGRETRDVLLEAQAVDCGGTVHRLPLAEMGLTYRHSGVPAAWIFTDAVFQGSAGDPAVILAEMEEVASYREANQPIRERTGGSTFKNPPGTSAWKLIDAAGCRGLVVGGAKVSELHCNFLINEANASAEDIERLGETVRARVRAHSGAILEWEIIRIGAAVEGRPTGEALAEEHVQ
jgi:UDP-N-acetylmuramate dehydrogenase